MSKNRLLSTAAAALLGAAALGAAPGAAGAAQTIGSDMSAAGSASWAQCAPAVVQAPCTYVLDKRGGGFEVYVEPGHVITRWSASMQPGSQARLVLLRRSEDRARFTAVAAGRVVNADGGVQSFPVRLRAGETGMTIGVELLAGGIAAAPTDMLGYATYVTPLAVGETRAPALTVDGDLLLAATAEPDLDGDDRGDESEDDCVFCDPGGGGGNGGGGSGGGGSDGGSGGGSGGGDDGGESDGGDRPIGKPSVTIEPRAILRSGVAGQKGYIEVYVRNPNRYDVSGWIQVKLGTTLLGRGEIDVERQDDHSWGLFRLPRRAVARLLRTGRLKVTAIASIRAAVGPAATIRRTITVLRGGASGYDGTYRGPGPVVIVVERGAIFAVSYPLNLFCTKSKRFRQMAFHTLGGFPALVRKDGSFSAKGSESADSITYRGKLKRNGTGKGYLSLFHTELWVDGGGLQSDTCFDARNWTVKRDR